MLRATSAIFVLLVLCQCLTTTESASVRGYYPITAMRPTWFDLSEEQPLIYAVPDDSSRLILIPQAKRSVIPDSVEDDTIVDESSGPIDSSEESDDSELKPLPRKRFYFSKSAAFMHPSIQSLYTSPPSDRAELQRASKILRSWLGSRR
ncbi:hypothetical protein AAVH_31184 [Aphelenchoides avenae]|nr:hypothetical protein AAVH_31184 [Aphelenchus avenae]